MVNVIKKNLNCLLLISSAPPNNSEKKDLDKLVKIKDLENNIFFLGLLNYKLLPNLYP